MRSPVEQEGKVVYQDRCPLNRGSIHMKFSMTRRNELLINVEGHITCEFISLNNIFWKQISKVHCRMYKIDFSLNIFYFPKT